MRPLPAGRIRRLAPFLCFVLAACATDESSDSDSRSDEGAGDLSFSRVFTDITSASGIDAVHRTGGQGRKLLPETLGSGAAFFDYDGDERLDALLLDSPVLPSDSSPSIQVGAVRLFRGDGGGSFREVTEEARIGVAAYAMGCAIADYDSDGDQDVYITALRDNLLLRNDDGVFHDVTAEAGVAGGRWTDRDGEAQPEWSTAAAWADFDGDGDIDLLVANYVQWTEAHEVFTTLDGATKAFTTPDRYTGLPCRLFLNRGDGRFDDASEPAGFLAHEGKALGVALWDLDGDGLVDIMVANDTKPNFVFLNRGEGRFEEKGLELGVAYDEQGRARAGMGIDIAEYSTVGVPAVAIGNFSEEKMSLWRRRADGVFESRSDAAGLAQATYMPLAFAVAFLDADLDSRLDLLVVNGHIEPDIDAFFPGQKHAQSAQLFRGTSEEVFEDVSDKVGAAFSEPRVGRGLALGDVDRDGDLDLLITSNGGRPALLRNDLKPGASPSHFLRVRLIGKGKNLDALGARVTLVAQGRKQTRVVRTGSSYLSASERVLTFGLGAATKVDRLVVDWPDRSRTEHTVLAVDTTLKLYQK